MTETRDLFLRLNDRDISYRVEGQIERGPPQVLLDGDDDLSQAFDDGTGFTVVPLFERAQDCYALIERLTTFLIEKIAQMADLALTGRERLEDYHLWGGRDEPLHEKIVEAMKECFDIEEYPGDPNQLTARISEICKTPLQVRHPTLHESKFCLRIVRPLSDDNNPPHRDAYMDHLRHGINIYLPICGSNSLSSLTMVPKSHRWMESQIERTTEGGVVNGRRFSVPAVTAADFGLDLVRPGPGPNEVLVFSPYLIHGGAKNLNKNMTRVSLEMRFWRRAE